jgi:hypothetical protein
MSGNVDTVSAALAEVDRLRATLKKKKSAQVRGQDERALVKATALTWFNVHRKTFAPSNETSDLDTADEMFRELLDASVRDTTRKSYLSLLKELRNVLIPLQSAGLTAPATAAASTTDQPPDFSPLASDAQMQAILVGRWQECVRCIGASAPLSATVMMGGLLETLLLGRINLESNKAPVYTAKAAPKDKKTGSTKNLSEWMLKDYIDVAHEMNWIGISAREVAVVLRDFRNYIHPHKQLVHGVHLTDDDAVLFWEVSKTISRQLLKNCKP